MLPIWSHTHHTLRQGLDAVVFLFDIYWTSQENKWLLISIMEQQNINRNLHVLILKLYKTTFTYQFPNSLSLCFHYTFFGRYIQSLVYLVLCVRARWDNENGYVTRIIKNKILFQDLSKNIIKKKSKKRNKFSRCQWRWEKTTNKHIHKNTEDNTS